MRILMVWQVYGESDEIERFRGELIGRGDIVFSIHWGTANRYHGRP